MGKIHSESKVKTALLNSFSFESFAFEEKTKALITFGVSQKDLFSQLLGLINNPIRQLEQGKIMSWAQSINSLKLHNDSVELMQQLYQRLKPQLLNEEVVHEFYKLIF
jgi:hypothetical protein